MTRRRVEDAGGRLSAATVAAVWRFGRSSWSAEVGGREVAWRVEAGGVAVIHPPADPGGSAEAYVVAFETTATPTGGSRWWWRCCGCGRRAGDLFLVAGRDRLSCRTCSELAYASQLTRRRGPKPAGPRVAVETVVERWSPDTGWVRTRRRR